MFLLSKISHVIPQLYILAMLLFKWGGWRTHSLTPNLMKSFQSQSYGQNKKREKSEKGFLEAALEKTKTNLTNV